MSFLKWWFFKGDKFGIAIKLLFLYSSIASSIVLICVFCGLFNSMLFPLTVAKYIQIALLLIHGWIIVLIVVVINIIKFEYAEYRRKVNE